MQEFLSAADAARLLGVTAAAVRLMERRGVLQAAARTQGGIRLFRRKTVERLQRQRAARRKPDLQPT